MKRKLFALFMTLAFFTSWLALPCQGRAQNRGPRRIVRPSSVTSGIQDARLSAIADLYLRGYYAFNPTRATALGLHDYDSALESRSSEAIAREVRRLRLVLAELGRVREGALSANAHYDYLVLVSHVRGQLLELEDIRMWQRNPNLYNSLLAASIDNILKRNYAPIEQRLNAVLARERQIPRLLNEARLNLQTPPRIYTEMALSQVRGSIDYFMRVVPQMIERAGGGRLSAARRAEINTTNESVIVALGSFVDWLQNNLLPRSTGDFRIGAENYRRKLLYDEMVDTPLAQLIQDGERELRRTQDEMRTLAEEITPGMGVIYAIRLLGAQHPTADGLVGETRAELDRIRAFVRAQNILPPPAQENLIVAETPEYRRATSFASMDAPGPFERVATEAFYYVTPPDPNWDARRREDHLSFFNRYSLVTTSIHEVYPGHYYQLLTLRNSPSRVRVVLGSASFVEGWGHYCEQMMLEEGFGGNNPKLRLAQLHAALLRLCRYLVSLRMHTQGMTYDEAVEFFIREGYQERVNAEREARRGTIDPTYLVYTLGKMEILKLREEWKQRMGESFRLGEFHDRLLSYGMPPIKILRMALLGDTGNRSASPSHTAENRFSKIDFSVLATGTMSSYEGGRAVELIMTENDWQRVWRIVGGSLSLPEVNFNTQAVIIVYQGQKPTGGYSVSITGINRDGTGLAVHISERRPAFGDITAQVITSPFVAVSIPRPPNNTSVRLDAGENAIERNGLERTGIVKPRARGAQRRGVRRP